LQKFLDIIDKVLFFFLLAFVFALPSFFARMCYSHCIAPKEFAVYAGAAVCGLLFSLPLMLKKNGPSFRVPAGVVLAALFVASLSLSFIATPSPQLSLVKLHYYIVIGLWAALYLYSSHESPDRIEAFLTAILLSGVFPALVLAGEAFGIGALKIWQNIDATGLTTRQTYVSTFGNPDFAAPFFGVLCALNIRFLLFRGDGWKKAPLWALQFLYAAALFIPLCRSSQIAFAAFLALYFFIISRIAPKKIPALINIIVSFFAVIFFIQLKDMLSASGETLLSRAFDLFFSGETASKRLYMLAVGWQIIKANFYFGAGLNVMLMIFPDYAQRIDQSSPLWDGIPYFFNPSHLHNEFFNIFAESGVLSFLLFTLLATSLIYFPLKTALRKGEKGEQAAILACAAAYILIDSCFNVTLSLPHLLFLFAVSGALAFNACQFEKNQYFSFDISGGFYRLVAGLLIILFSFLSAIFGIKYIKADWCLMQGKIYQVSGEDDKALKFYEMSSSLLAERTEPHVFAADIHKTNGRFAEAAEALIKATNINLSLPVVYELAQIAIRHMDLNTEFRYLYFLTRSYPRFDEPHYLLGLWYMKIKTLNPKARAEAAACFERALKINPKHISARMSLAEVHYEMLKYRKAAEDIDEALKISPGLKNAFYLRSLLKGFFYDEF
jgi:tetratricopeptide (TPR) repeat protein